MAQLNTKPGSSSKAQHTTLVCAAKRRGYELAEIRKEVGGSLRRLSAKDCSDWITHFSGKGLANPPGKKPREATRKVAGVTRMIDDAHLDQICRLLLLYFGDDSNAAFTWLGKNFKECAAAPERYRGGSLPPGFDTIRKLATAQRGGEVIRVLKAMIARRDAKQNRTAPVRKRPKEVTR